MSVFSRYLALSVFFVPSLVLFAVPPEANQAEKALSTSGHALSNAANTDSKHSEDKSLFGKAKSVSFTFREKGKVESPSFFLFNDADKSGFFYDSIGTGGNKRNQISEKGKGLEMPIDGMTFEISAKDPKKVNLKYIGTGVHTIEGIPLEALERGDEIALDLGVYNTAERMARSTSTSYLKFKFDRDSQKIKLIEAGTDLTVTMRIGGEHRDADNIKEIWATRGDIPERPIQRTAIPPVSYKVLESKK